MLAAGYDLPENPTGSVHAHDNRHIADGADGSALPAPLDDDLIRTALGIVVWQHR